MTDPDKGARDAAETPKTPEPYAPSNASAPAADTGAAAPPAPVSADVAETRPLHDPHAASAVPPASGTATAPRPRKRGWVIGGIVAGGIVALGLAFGGGVAVGLGVGVGDGNDVYQVVGERGPGGPGFGTDGDRPAPGGGQFGDRDGDHMGPGHDDGDDDGSDEPTPESTPDA